MVELGLEEKYESDHELVWAKGDYTIELHKRLIPSYNEDYYAYFGDGWKLVSIIDEETKECRMSIEDQFIYSFVHYAKHYRDGGIGVKHVTDFYVFMEKNPNMDFEYIENELEKLHLLKFWKNTKKVLDVWFNSEEGDELTDFMTAKIFNSGAYGKVEEKIQADALRTSGSGKNARKRKTLSLIFPSLSDMKLKYKVLKKAPILLPFMWMVRWIEAIFTPSKVKAQKKRLDMISQEGVNKYQNELEYVGLSFDFE